VLAPKRLEFLHEMVPKAGMIGMLLNPNFAGAEIESGQAQEAASTLGLQLHVLNAANEPDIDAAFSTFSKLKISALLVANDSVFLAQRGRLAALAAHHAIPAIYPYREYVTAGGLMSYAPSLTDSYRQAGIYTGKILNGANPADLPVIQPTKFDLVINLKTLEALGLTIPPLISARADELIE
jgi:putative ABC transport system substrate-binding protein